MSAIGLSVSRIVFRSCVGVRLFGLCVQHCYPGYSRLDSIIVYVWYKVDNLHPLEFLSYLIADETNLD